MIYYSLIVIYIFFTARQHRNKWADKQTAEEITDTVNGIPRKTRGYPRNGLLKIKAEKQCLRWCIKRTVEKSVRWAEAHINDALLFFRHIPWKQKSRGGENRPQIEVRNPPQRKARKQSKQKNKGINGIECFFSVNDCHWYSKNTEQMYIGKKLQRNFWSIHKRTQHTKQCYLFRA